MHIGAAKLTRKCIQFRSFAKFPAAINYISDEIMHEYQLNRNIFYSSYLQFDGNIRSRMSIIINIVCR